MNEIQRVGDAAQPGRQRVNGHRPLRLARSRLPFMKRPAGEILHDGERHALVLPRIQDADDVRMRQFDQRADLACEPPREAALPQQLGERDLDDDLALQIRVPREVDGRHAPVAQLARDLVAVLVQRRSNPGIRDQAHDASGKWGL